MTAGQATDCNPAVRFVAKRVSLDDQVALVTGGSRGIGRAMSAAIGKAGASVCVVARNPERLAETMRELEELEISVVTIAGDVSNPADVSAAVDQVTAELGPIDLLVNNAGVQTSIGDCAVVDQKARWDDVRGAQAAKIAQVL